MQDDMPYYVWWYTIYVRWYAMYVRYPRNVRYQVPWGGDRFCENLSLIFLCAKVKKFSTYFCAIYENLSAWNKVLRNFGSFWCYFEAFSFLPACTNFTSKNSFRNCQDCGSGKTWNGTALRRLKITTGTQCGIAMTKEEMKIGDEVNIVLKRIEEIRTINTAVHTFFIKTIL